LGLPSGYCDSRRCREPRRAAPQLGRDDSELAAFDGAPIRSKRRVFDNNKKCAVEFLRPNWRGDDIAYYADGARLICLSVEAGGFLFGRLIHREGAGCLERFPKCAFWNDDCARISRLQIVLGIISETFRRIEHGEVDIQRLS
jgi:hypothetical protein